jgi:hypothetical protein
MNERKRRIKKMEEPVLFSIHHRTTINCSRRHRCSLRRFLCPDQAASDPSRKAAAHQLGFQFHRRHHLEPVLLPLCVATSSSLSLCLRRTKKKKGKERAWDQEEKEKRPKKSQRRKRKKKWAGREREKVRPGLTW